MPYYHAQFMQIEIEPKKVAGPVLLLVGWILILVAVAAVGATAGRWVLIIIGLLLELAGLIFFGLAFGRKLGGTAPGEQERRS